MTKQPHHSHKKKEEADNDNEENKKAPPEVDKEDIERTDQDQGLSKDEAKKRLEENGENALKETGQNPWMILLRHIWGPIPWMIEAAAILSLVVLHWLDFGVIMAMLVINAVVGFWEEYKADKEIEELKKKLAPEATVRREGEWKKISAKKLVVGDIVRVEAGNIVPADLLLAGDGSLSLDESALTGESMPVDKEDGDEAYSGSAAKRGSMVGQVTATGMDTYFGKTAKLAQSERPTSHLQQAVIKIGHFLMIVTGILVVAVLIAAYLRSNPLLEAVQFCLILTVAAIPVALPAVMSITMAVGAGQLAKRKAIVSRLVAIEEMAGVDLLLADKTGTLTQNKLTVDDPVAIEAEDTQDILLAAALASRQDSEDAIDKAIFAALDDEATLGDYDIQEFNDFDASRKYADARVKKDGTSFHVAKGAAQAILELTKADKKTAEKVHDTVDDMASHGYRALAVARKDDKSWQVLGVLPMSDPPREDSAETIRQARNLGLDIRMVTGDHEAIAKEIAGELELGTDIVVADDLFDEDGNPTDKQALLEAKGYAQVFPEHKFNIVSAFQDDGHIVGMTGDGVNDAPALRRADIGVAVSGATDAARAAADLVLTSPGLSVIVHAIEQARLIFGRMQSYAIFRIAETVRVLLFMTLSILIFNFYPVTAVMIVLLALMNDFPIMMIAYDNTERLKRPVRWQMGHVLTVSGVLGLLGVICSFLLFWYVQRVMGLPEETVQSLIFLKLLVAGHMTIYITRRHSWFWSKPWPSWKLIVATETTQILGTLAAVYGWLIPPIGWPYALAVWAYALVWFFINDAIKILVNRRWKETS